ncbi:hypothetical protein [Phytomonospora endophytica]|uniref:Uncharacterized protein n=1 Tax=Phytomonospora endophytica TaxID=714109 RepID=A0A841FKV5_9ACTN|nr:hypothetical protein [Phytomonospora endophytica]MBB6035553.1 hypothetical protein [Phytomonospora endophytica]GIG70084.1 hypothetical protein Pen01_63790 [Phytomonospora endophytica]
MSTEENTPSHRKRRWALGAGALTVAVAATVVVIAVNRTTPEDVVEDYFAHLLARDAEGALEYTDQLAFFADTSADLLVPAAMADDWEVTRLVRRHNEDEDPAAVDVTITAADGTSREGRFELVEGDDGWRILNPLVKLRTGELPADFLELNGVVSTAENLWLFPGAYRPYPSLAEVVTAPSYVAVPRSGDGRDQPDGIVGEKYLPLFAAGPELADALQRGLAAWLDACAAQGLPNPTGCPFKAGYGGANRVALEDGSEYNTPTVVWEVEKYPVVRLTPGPSDFSLITVAPGVIRVSGEGRPYYHPDRPVEKFSGRCGFSLGAVTVRIAPGGFAFGDRDVYSSTCLSPFG